jgi:hypothetical protein
LWFEAGAEAFSKSLPNLLRNTFPDGGPPVYVCPLCLHAFAIEALRTGELTTEHVPPKSLNGREYLLTCLGATSTQVNGWTLTC